MRLIGLLMRFVFSAGAALPITARAWRATFMCTCYRESNASLGSMLFRARIFHGQPDYFKDGRDFPDLLATLYDYPGVSVNVHCNQNNAFGRSVPSFTGRRPRW